MTNGSDDHRAAAKAAIQNGIAKLETEAAKAQAELERKIASLKAKALRLDKPLPSPDACPVCWYDRGEASQMRPIASDTSDDVFRCRCGHEETRSP